ncbi:TonB-dependent receptor domain-containing protein [Leptolyngbya sp. 7M]|uniref:TonB-dependent receptor domain-containing protein n=1 Tax=Leptolyngbya sp. 7M TaxID=2812896 RepID=UPI001B8CB416|nr:TonB-dependent receptor [Leptolyngbya sp. 7M]
MDLFEPDYGAVAPIAAANEGGSFFQGEDTTWGLYLQDQITLLDNLKLLIGGRFDFIETTSQSRPSDVKCGEAR